jgi:hypothetical protein
MAGGHRLRQTPEAAAKECGPCLFSVIEVIGSRPAPWRPGGGGRQGGKKAAQRKCLILLKAAKCEVAMTAGSR